MQKLDIKLMHPKDQIVLILSRIYNRGLTTTSGGNISVIDENGDIWITPSGVDNGSLQIRDIMCLKQNGQTTGLHKPSSELPFHKSIYEIRTEIINLIRRACTQGLMISSLWYCFVPLAR